ncbi:MAG: UDP-N-acetylmuramate dehydrogenase [Alphaproteobacteria bacterium]|nr:UDP-N-acetylmuramate dehydrogenase [Alphaproteobacteria bacterium]
MKRLFRKIFRGAVLKKMLPPLRGLVRANEPLKRRNWLGVGGAAEVYFEPKDAADLSALIRAVPEEMITVLGAGSNTLIRDGGVPGVVVHLGRDFAQIQVKGNTLACGAGALMSEIARAAEKNGIAGFEFMCGIPGTLGGGIRMNAGAFGRSMRDAVVEMQAVLNNGQLHTLRAKGKDLFGYRECYIPSDWIFVSAVLRGRKLKSAAAIAKKRAAYQQKRDASQPRGVRTLGSTFKNPQGLQAWKLIDKCGLRGARIRDAQVSGKHTNFLVNAGNARAKDFERLIDKIQTAVLRDQGVPLELEIRKIGVEK